MINKKLIFMGTPTVASEYLKTLIMNKIKIDAVFTQPPKQKSRGMKISKTPVHLLAIENEIDVFHPNFFDPVTINKLSKIKPDLIIVMAYGKILPKEILELPPYGCINIHVSILPRWRGAAPIEHALMNGDKETGVSIIKLNEKLDAGPIIAQKKIKIPEYSNKLQLTNLLLSSGKKLLIDTIPKIINNEITLKNQNEQLATYANKINSETRKIDFNNTSIAVINQIRAHSPKPGAWIDLNKERIKIFDAKPGFSKGKISTILNKNFEIGCNDGSIIPLLLQREGKNILTKEEFLRGFNLKVNETINV